MSKRLFILIFFIIEFIPFSKKCRASDFIIDMTLVSISNNLEVDTSTYIFQAVLPNDTNARIDSASIIQPWLGFGFRKPSCIVNYKPVFYWNGDTSIVAAVFFGKNILGISRNYLENDTINITIHGLNNPMEGSYVNDFIFTFRNNSGGVDSFINRTPYTILSNLIFNPIPIIPGNLVQNGDFETYSSCPYKWSQIDSAPPWINTPGYAFGGNSDYFNYCSLNDLAGKECFGTPQNFRGFQMPKSGKGYAGLVTYSSNPIFREYFQAFLFDTLISGNTYCFEMSVSLGDYDANYGTDDLGVHIANTLIGGPPGPQRLVFEPSIKSTPGVILNSKTDWTLISGDFVANGGELYITIGSFLHDSLINIGYAGGDTSLSKRANYFVDDISLVPYPNPVISNLFSSDTICKGDSIILFVSATPHNLQNDYSYSWNTSPMQTNDTIKIFPDSTFYYIVEVSGYCGLAFDTIHIVVIDIVKNLLGNDTIICPSDSLILDAAINNATYLWQDGSIDSILIVDTTGVYNVVITHDNICIGFDTISVIEINDDPTIIPIDNYCINDPADTIRALNIGGTWIGVGMIDSIFFPSIAGSGIHQIAYNICDRKDTAYITVKDFPNINLGPDTILCTNSIELSLTNMSLGLSLLWSTGDSTSVITVNSSGEYFVIASNTNCIVSDSILVYPCSFVYIPNAFSPNGDGENDVFMLWGEGIATLSFQIYDRWGKQVFMSDNNNNGWDGKVNNRPASEGVYVYKINGISLDNSKIDLKGNITLIR